MIGAFEIVLCALALIPVATGGALLLAGGRHGRQPEAPASLDSDLRFLGGAWFAYTGFVMLLLADPARYAPLFYVACAGIVLGGIGRIVSWARVGRPDAIGLVAIAVEIIIIPLMMLWFWLRRNTA